MKDFWIVKMPNHKEHFNIRKKNNTAEKFFEFYCARNNITCARYGMDQLNSGITGKEFITIDKMIRNSPDYIMISKGTYFVEVKGCKDSLGMKLSDIESYRKWNEIMPVLYFVYSATFNQYKIIEHENFVNIIGICETKRYPDNNEEYYCVPWRLLNEGV